MTGGGDEVGSALLVNDDIRVVSFTGSTDVGRAVSEKTAPSFKKVHLEMGGKNVVIVMDDANLELGDRRLRGAASAQRVNGNVRPPAASSSTRRCTGRSSIDSLAGEGACVGDGLDPGTGDGAVGERRTARRL